MNMYDPDIVSEHCRRVANVPTASQLGYADFDLHTSKLFEAVEYRNDGTAEEWMLIDAEFVVHDVERYR